MSKCHIKILTWKFCHFVKSKLQKFGVILQNKIHKSECNANMEKETFLRYVPPGQCDQILEQKRSPNVSKSFPISIHSSFYIRVKIFKLAQTVANNLGYFCRQELSKIAQSGHTGQAPPSVVTQFLELQNLNLKQNVTYLVITGSRGVWWCNTSGLKLKTTAALELVLSHDMDCSCGSSNI